MAVDLATLRPRRVLIVKPSALGDVVHALPVVRLLRRRWPTADLAWLVAPAFAGLIDGHPDVSRVVRFDRRGLADPDRGASVLLDWVGLGERLAAERFDVVVDLQGLLRTAMLSVATDAPVRVGFGYAREGAWLAYTHRVGRPRDADGSHRHAVDRYLDVAEAFGCDRRDVAFDFHVTEADRAHVRGLVSGPYAVLLPGTNWETKRWPIEGFARLAELIAARLGLRPVLAGGPDVVGLGEQVPAALDLAGRTSLPQLVALLDGAAVVVANDSGPMHVAAALGRPLVALFGPTDPVRTGPFGRLDAVLRVELPCSPCLSRRCVHQSCLRWLDAEDVLREVERAMR